MNQAPSFKDSHPSVAPALPALIVVGEAPDHGQAIEAVTDLAFGPGRHARPSYALREGMDPVDGLGLVAIMEDQVVGTLRFWEVAVDGGPRTLLLGPLAIHPAHQGQGIGRALMASGLGAAMEQGWKAVLLVGDEPYYRKFGFTREVAQGITMQGLADPERLLGLELTEGALQDAAGDVKRAAHG